VNINTATDRVAMKHLMATNTQQKI